MQKIFPLVLIIGAALCFYAGYIMGQKNPKIRSSDVNEATPATETVETSGPAEPRAVPATDPEDSEPEDTEPEDSEPAEPLVEAEETTSQAEFEARAQARYITFTDPSGRELDAEILEVGKERLKIRRRVDQRVMDLPIPMLSEDDQAFARYLWEQSPKEDMQETRDAAPPRDEELSRDEEMLRQLFGE